MVIGLLGSVLDAGVKASRWERWRPSVSLCQHEDLRVDRLDLLSGRRHLKLANRVEKDVRQVSPETEVVRHPLELADPWDFQEVFGALFDFARDYPFAPEEEDYLIHITTGSHVARIDLWTFRMPGLAERREDIEPNLRFELERFAERSGQRVTFNKEALERFLDFATSPAAAWRGNFRDLSAAVTRMATLAPGGRITPAGVDDEIARLRAAWSPPADAHRADLSALLGPDAPAALDLFDQLQLAQVVSVCRQAASLSEAGRRLFQASRRRKKSANDADRLRKYLARHGLSWGDVVG